MIQWHIEITEWAPPVKLQRSVEGDSDVTSAEPRSAENKPFVLQNVKSSTGGTNGILNNFFISLFC